MPVVLLLAAVAVVAATVVLASGRGGELREPAMERPPTGLPEGRPPTGAEAAMLHLPKSVWGYDPAVTDEALGRLVYALMRREEEVAELERRLAGAAAYGPGEVCQSHSPLPGPDDAGERRAWPYGPGEPARPGGEDRA